MASYPENFVGGHTLRRHSPSLPPVSARNAYPRSDAVSSRMADYGGVLCPVILAELGDLRPGTPQMDIRPLTFRGSQQLQQCTHTATTPGGVYTTVNSDIGSVRSRHPPTPQRKSSAGVGLKRSYTVDGRKSAAYISQLDGPSDLPERKKSYSGARGMAWLQRPERKDTKTKAMDAIRDSPITTLPSAMEGKRKTRERAFTAPPNPTTGVVAARGGSDVKRAISSGSRLKKAFALGVDTSIDEESLEQDDAVEKVKRWKRRVFSKDFFKPESKAQKLERENSTTNSIETAEEITQVAPSVRSGNSSKTVVTKQSLELRGSSDTAASQAASTVDEYQVDGVGHKPPHDDPTEKVFNDSVIGMIDGKVGGITRPRCGQQWKPPMLTLDLKAISPVDRIPVKVSEGNEIWIAVVLQGRVVGDIDLPGAAGNTAGIGLDVGVLLDISSYTSPESFEGMKREAKHLVEAMETSRDRIAVMTFSPPSFGKRKTSPRGRAGLRVLNSSGSVAKKQLIEDILGLQPGLSANPSGRNVFAAVKAAVKTLQNMPSDTSKYGTKRSGHLFLLTSKLDPGMIQGDLGGIKVHVLGVGPVFNPTSSMGGGGWCAALESPLDPVHGLRKIVADGVEIPVEKPSGTTNVKSIINLLRMGIDLGVIERGDLFFYPGEGCKLKGVLGDMSFPKLLPGERKSLMVKLEVGDLPGCDADSLDIDGAERQLQATLGELSSSILTVEAAYNHSHFNAPTTRITSKVDVEVSRYVEGCVWGSSTPELNNEMPVFFTEGRRQSDKAQVNAVLVHVLAAHHASAREARRAVEQLRDHIDSPAVLRELGYQVYLEDRFGIRPKIIRDLTTAAYSGPMMEDFERRFSSDQATIVDLASKVIPREFDTGLLVNGTFGNGDRDQDFMHTQSDSELYHTSRRVSSQRCRSPDEAKRLWMRLTGYEEDDAGELSMSDDDFDEMDDRDIFYSTANVVERRNSVGQETLITLRDVRETDFSPWLL